MRKVTMVRGLPGSGKTTFIKDMLSLDPYAVHISFDVVQEFNQLELTPDNNDLLLHKVRDLFVLELSKGTTHILVEGFSEDSMVEDYKRLSNDYGYMFTSIVMENRHSGNSVNSWHDSEVLKEAQSKFSIKL